MTQWEAKIILGLREEDEVDKEGLDRYEKILRERMAISLDKQTQSRARRELKAIQKLREFYFQR